MTSVVALLQLVFNYNCSLFIFQGLQSLTQTEGIVLPNPPRSISRLQLDRLKGLLDKNAVYALCWE